MWTRGLELVSGSHRRQGQGLSRRFQRRQRSWGGNGPKRLGEGHPPQTEAPRGCDLLRHGGSIPAGIAQWWQHQCAPRQHWSSGEKIQQHREIGDRGRRSEGAAPSLLGSATDESRGARVPGQPGSRVSGVCWSSAHSQCLSRRFYRDGGGNTAESDTMWVIGRVQSAAAEWRSGVGVYAEAARQN
jgi:hypothetical protein